MSPIMTDTELAEALTRRGLFGAVGALSALASSSALAQPAANPVNVRKDGRADVAPLKKDVIDYACIQSPVWPVDPKNPKPGIRDNLAKMSQLLDELPNSGSTPDLVSFHEFPIGGYAFWTRTEMLKVAIEIPGEET